jgi:hypothetical protein
MRVHTRRVVAFAALSGAVIACSHGDATRPEGGLPGAEPTSTPAADSTASAAPPARPRSAEPLSGIVVALTIDRSVAAPGDTIEFVAAATNTGSQRRIRWRVPSARGTCSAVSGLRRADGLGNVSEPVLLTVR